MPERIMAAMSGGVDSAVAAALLLDMDFDTLGGTMRLNGLPEEERAIEGAAATCDMLAIDHCVFDLRQVFLERVVAFFTNSYISGATPNPCAYCNRYVKFPEFIKAAQSEGCGKIATGHYARVNLDSASGRWMLRKGVDRDKDQSYFLYGLSQQTLSKVIFPLGDMTKTQIRQLAARLNLPVAEKKDSQDICFIPAGGTYMDVLRDAAGYRPRLGSFVDSSGQVLGVHQGAAAYTIGQRRGLGVSSSGRMYVVDKDMEKNTVTLGQSSELYKRSVRVSDINFVSIAPRTGDFFAQVKLRYSKEDHSARVVMTGPDTCLLEFPEPQRAPARGQAAVFYDGDVLLGGGIIE